MIRKLPVLTPGNSLSDVVTLAAPSVVADSNGFFHPLGDHPQVQFSLDNPLTSCNSVTRGALRLRIPTDGAANDDHNPPRIAPRTLFDLNFGTDILFRPEPTRLTLRVTIVNLTNRVALYNFLSTFGGTHFVPPRTVLGQLE